MNVYEKLLKVQVDLKAPKSQYNSFGKYSYRNCEDILEAFKPLGKEAQAVLTINDELVLIGDRYYIKAIVTFVDVETSESIVNVAYAREEENKKGMDSSQVTGATSSYARKYALNGLLCIDDTKDADSQDNTSKGATQKDKPPYKPPTKQSEYKCETCGTPFTDFVWKNKNYTAKDGFEIAKNKCNGKALCNDCKKKLGGEPK